MEDGILPGDDGQPAVDGGLMMLVAAAADCGGAADKAISPAAAALAVDGPFPLPAAATTTAAVSNGGGRTEEQRVGNDGLQALLAAAADCTAPTAMGTSAVTAAVVR